VLGINPNGKGAIRVMELNKNKMDVVVEADKEQGFKCGTFGASLYEQRYLATGSYGGKLEIWDLDRLESPVFSVQAHNTLVNCLDGVGGLNIGGGAPELATAARDGKVKIWDPRQSLPVASLEPAAGEAARDCWAVCFGNSYSDTERTLCAGFDNGDIKLLDLRMNKISWETNIKNGVVGLEFDRKDIKMNKLVVTTLESKFRVFDMRTQHPEEGFASMTEKAHKSTVWLAKHLPQNRDLFMTCGGNGTLNMYKYQYPKERFRETEDGKKIGVMGSNKLLNSKKLAEQPIVSFDWHMEKQGLAVMCALDQTVKVALVTKLDKY
jgi:hypothetical protein